LSYKQFKRVFAEYTGANPKDWLRTVRFQKALYTLQTQPAISLAQLACECGYYDQPHLIKEFKTFSGYTPVEYSAIYAPCSDYFS
jgi:transcriptional regulator GlxA family with amidase domain